jgi:hypothetical protein
MGPVSVESAASDAFARLQRLAEFPDQERWTSIQQNGMQRDSPGKIQPFNMSGSTGNDIKAYLKLWHAVNALSAKPFAF